MFKLCLILAGAALAGHAGANSDPLTDVLPSGGAGIGPAVSAERSPYRGAGVQYDFVPLYVYEGEHLYLHSYSAGLKFGSGTLGFGPGTRHSACLHRRGIRYTRCGEGHCAWE